MPAKPSLSGDVLGLAPPPLVALNMDACVEPVGGRAGRRGLIGLLVVCMDLSSLSVVWPRVRGAFGSWDRNRNQVFNPMPLMNAQSGMHGNGMNGDQLQNNVLCCNADMGCRGGG